MSDTGTLWLLNWDACVTKTFDVIVAGFLGDGQSKSGIVAGASAVISFKQDIWEPVGSDAYLFTLSMQNLDQTLADESFSGSGSAADGDFTTSGKISIKIKHTPK